MALKIVLAGFGVMGRHYAGKLAAHQAEWGVEIAAIVDNQPQAFNVDPQMHPVLHDVLARTPLYQDIQTALQDHQPDIVINTTNNEAHIEMIRALALAPQAKLFLTEKPLVNLVSEEAEAEKRLQDHFVSMNMVTNFSAAAKDLRAWIGEHPELRLIGVDAVWGKDRRKDTRPTPGIANDIVHPVGLVQSIFGAQDWALQHSQGSFGTLSMDRQNRAVECVYHSTSSFSTSVAPVRVDASFAWKDQARRVTGFFQDQDGSYKVAELFLDEADAQGSGKRADFFRVYDVSADFDDIRLLYESPLATEDKITAFLQSSIEAFRQNALASSYGLVGLAEERDIGKVYGLLHPSDDKQELLQDKALGIREQDPAQAPLDPLFTRMDRISLAELKNRIATFKPLSPCSPTPVSAPAPSP